MNRTSCYAQDIGNLDNLTDDIETLLPPLQTIIDSAIAKNPDVKAREHLASAKAYNLKSDRARWTENLGLQADARYGTFNNFSMNTGVGQTPSNLATLDTQFNYGVGAYIRLPLFDFANRKNMLGAGQSALDEAVSQVEVQRDLLRQLIIRQYHDLILKQRLLRIRSKYLETARINMVMAEKEFQNGVIPLSEYSRIADITTTSEETFETAKIEFITSYMLLEQITKTKFILTTIKQIKHGDK